MRRIRWGWREFSYKYRSNRKPGGIAMVFVRYRGKRKFLRPEKEQSKQDSITRNTKAKRRGRMLVGGRR